MTVFTMALASLLMAQQPQQPCDPTAIKWVLPGDFGTALKRSQTEKRLIAIKGIAFGVDEEGAVCATKGCW